MNWKFQGLTMLVVLMVISTIGCERHQSVFPILPKLPTNSPRITNVEVISHSGGLEALEVNTTSLKMGIGQQYQLQVNAVYFDGQKDNVTAITSILSSNSSIVDISSTGLVKAVGTGKAKATLRYQEISVVVNIVVVK